MNTNILYVLALTSFLFVFSNCGNSDETPPEEMLTEISCCEIPHLQACAGGAKFYVPNVFTPNGDGLNDIFYPITALDGKGIQTFNSFRVLTLDDEVIYSTSNHPSPFSINIGWDGAQTDGTIQDGIYKYTIEVTNIADETFSFTGHVCCRSAPAPRPCGDFERHCAYPFQHNGNGEFEYTLPSQEEPCQ